MRAATFVFLMLGGDPSPVPPAARRSPGRPDSGRGAIIFLALSRAALLTWNRLSICGLPGAPYRRPRMLTLDLIDRLLASRLVPRDAKLAAIESWRRELAAMREKHLNCGRLEQRLAAASRMLAAPHTWAA